MSSGTRDQRDDTTDVEESDEEQETGDEAEEDPPVTWFYPMPISKLVLFGVLGSFWFCMYWMYRCWHAYRAAWGYSKRDFWRKVHAATGFEISPFWRAALAGGYCFALYPAVQRESKAARLRGLGAPIVLAFLFNALVFAASSDDPFTRLLYTPVWAILPAQLAINRLNARSGVPIGFRTSAGELAFVALGAFLTYSSLGGSGAR
jgi:hypothetical protein